MRLDKMVFMKSVHKFILTFCVSRLDACQIKGFTILKGSVKFELSIRIV